MYRIPCLIEASEMTLIDHFSRVPRLAPRWQQQSRVPFGTEGR